MHWDVGFWAERLREAKYSISDEQLRPYFALPNVLNGLFQVPPAYPDCTLLESADISSWNC